MKERKFQNILKAVEGLSVEEQQDLIELLKRRIHETQRTSIISDDGTANQRYSGSAALTTPSDELSAESNNVALEKIRQLPESLSQEVSDFIDFIMLKRNSEYWRLWEQFKEAHLLTESDFADYLYNLETYEESLADGVIQW